MAKVRSIDDITPELIQTWRSDRVCTMLARHDREQCLVQAFEDGLYGTPRESKLTPQEVIYALATGGALSTSCRDEIKAIARAWIDHASAGWTDHVPPLYSVEVQYIAERAA